MSLDAWVAKASEPEVVEYLVRAVGGTTEITKVYGRNIAVSRTGAGDYRLTFGDAPGTFIGATATLQAATESALLNHTVVIGTWSASGKTLDFVVDNGTAAHDLAANEWVTLRVAFARTSI